MAPVELLKSKVSMGLELDSHKWENAEPSNWTLVFLPRSVTERGSSALC